MCLFWQSIESRLKVILPEDLGSSLMDGVVLCHLVNHIRPRSVASIHVPSPAVVCLWIIYSTYCTHSLKIWLKCANIHFLFMCMWNLQPKLSMAKCRKNVENFLDACRKMGVPEVTTYFFINDKNSTCLSQLTCFYNFVVIYWYCIILPVLIKVGSLKTGLSERWFNHSWFFESPV